MKFLPKTLAEQVAQQLANASFHCDANETALFVKQLEYVQTAVYEQRFPELKFRSLFPVQSGVIGPVMDSYVYTETTKQGSAKVLDNYSLSDFPTVEIDGKRTAQLIKSIGAKYHYTLQEMRVSSALGAQLETRKAIAAREFVERKMDQLVATGDGTWSGVLNHSAINTVTITTKAAPAVGNEWLTPSLNLNATPFEIVADIRALVEKAVYDSRDRFGQFTVVVGRKGALALGKDVNSSTSGVLVSKSIKQYALESIPNLAAIETWGRCDTAGAGSLERILCFPKDPSVLEVIVPSEFEQFAPQLDGMQFVVPCHARFGGVVVREAKALYAMDGTQS